MKFLAVAVVGGGILYYMNSGPKGIVGPGIATSDPIEFTTRLPDGRTVYCGQNVVQGYTTNIVMIASDGEARYIPTSSNQAVNISSIFDPTQWTTYGPAAGYTLV
jgi:hypothetical protein